MMKKVLMILCCLPFAGYAQTITLKDCIEAAMKNNPRVKDAEWQVKTGNINLRQSKAMRLPMLSTGITHGLNQGRSIDPFSNTYLNQEIVFATYSVNANVVVWNGGNLRNSQQRESLSMKADELDLQQVRDNVMIEVVLAYLQVLNNSEQLKLARQQAEVTRQQVKRLELLHERGAIAPALLYDLKGQLGSDELNAITISNQVESAKIALVRVINIDYAPGLQLQPLAIDAEPGLYTDQPDAVMQLASTSLPLLKAAAFRTAAAKKEIAAARGSRLPSLVVSAGLGTNYSSAASTLNLLGKSDVLTADYVIVNGNKTPVYSPQNKYGSQKISYAEQWKNNFNSGVSIGLRIPILNAAQAKTRIASAVVQAGRSEFLANSAATGLKQEVQQAHLDFSTALQRYNTLVQQVRDFEESFRAATVRFEAGLGTPVDYLVAKNNLDRSRGNLVAARFDYLLRKMLLDYYSGKPVR